MLNTLLNWLILILWCYKNTLCNSYTTKYTKCSIEPACTEPVEVGNANITWMRQF